jgi:hypothetical protein
VTLWQVLKAYYLKWWGERYMERDRIAWEETQKAFKYGKYASSQPPKR